MPKPLIQVAGMHLISWIFLSAQEAGLDRFAVVTGYRGDVLEDFLGRTIPREIVKRFHRNELWQRPNGLSVLRANGHIEDPFFLLTADHIFDAKILRKLTKSPLTAGC
ncbi:MAG: NTP transferase domain-containing protein [Syntrophales bacterium LBB04]|nr:NTP transferase domain-containing protein [Syntrophales bacterium LBB04]